jgi:RimJ/RimL family protein N-acetyltransferase
MPAEALHAYRPSGLPHDHLRPDAIAHRVPRWSLPAKKKASMEDPGRSIQGGLLTSQAPGVSLTDGVVELRPLTVIDAAEHWAGQDGELDRWLNGGPGSLAGILNWLRRREEYWRAGGPVFGFGIRDPRRKTLLGTLELRVGERYLEPGQATISYGLYPQARGRGVAVRACRLGCTFALRALTAGPWAVSEVVAHIDPFNAGSLRVVDRVGFRHVDSRVGAGEAWELFAMDLSRRLPTLLAS